MGHVGAPDYHSAIEVCCGLGGLSTGAEWAGVRVLTALDISKYAVEHFNLNHEAKALHGDLHNTDHVMHLAEQIQRHSVGLLMGFPCPPFSSMGDGKGFGDSRAWTFVAGLDCAYLLNSAFIVLECTPHVESFQGLVDFLSSFSSVMGFSWKSQILRLHRAWPVRRTRWWCVMAPAALMHHLCLEDLPVTDCLACVGDLFPEWPLWSVEDELLLSCLSDEKAFLENFASLAELMLDLGGICPTLLHSLGHLNRACPCGCRAQGLSCDRLARDGVTTVLLKCHHSDELRYPHAKEAGFLCTLPPGFLFLDPRASLPLVGQTAAPLQAHWIVTLLQRAIHCALPDQMHEPNQFVEHRKRVRALLSLGRNLWIQPSITVKHIVTFQFGDSCALAIEVPELLTVDDFIQVQLKSNAWSPQLTLFLEGELVPFGAFLFPRTYRLVEVGPSVCAALSLRSGSFVFSFRGWTWFGCLSQRTTLAMVLGPLGFPSTVPAVLHAGGGRFSMHDLLPPTPVGQLCIDHFHGAGTDPLCGLSNSTMDSEAALLLDSVHLPSAFCFLSPTDFSCALDLSADRGFDEVVSLIPVSASKLFGIFCWQDHWAAISFDKIAGVATYYDGFSGHAAAVRDLFRSISIHWNQPLYVIKRHSLVQQHDGSHCGAIALVNLGAFLGLWNTFEEATAIAWHTRISDDMMDFFLPAQFRGRGAADHTRAHDLLVQELPKHGVPDKIASSRAALAIKKLGIAPILRAFESKNVWMALKALGSSMERPFQWVQHSELEQHIKDKAHNKRAPMTKPVKKVQAKSRQVHLEPDQVTVAPEAFCDPAGDPVAGLPFAEFCSTARGVVVASVDQAARFLDDDKVVSIDALALVTLTEVRIPTQSKLTAETVVWPGILVNSNEPLLIRGTLIQLGDERVALKLEEGTQTSVETDLLRLFVYRDQWTQSWDMLTSGPLKTLIGHFEPLQYCPRNGCASSCKKFHAAVEESGINLVVLDAFAWKWMDEAGKPATATKASTFSIMVRVPRSGTKALLGLSGTDGFYVELRTDPGDNPSHAVIWVKSDFNDAKHKLHSIPAALHIVRFHSKYGLRCAKKDEEALHKALFPDRAFVDCGTGLHYEMGPWPHGATKLSIIEFLQNFKWPSKPLKPVRGGHHGRYWLIGSSEEPPTMFAEYAGQFLTITKVKETTAVKPAPPVVASMKTLHRLAHPAVLILGSKIRRQTHGM
eukprot:Skav208838  [mRNA]  locus=scaffold1193:172877:176524:+ [translate_table: standard]